MAEYRREVANISTELAKILALELRDLLIKKTKKRKCWVRPCLLRTPRMVTSEQLLYEISEDHNAYKKQFRMTDKKFEELLSGISNKIQKQDTIMREALSARVKLQITLHYLATGDSFQYLSILYRVAKNTISQFIPEVCDAIYESLSGFIRVPNSAKEWKIIQQSFYKQCNFHLCCGAIDIKQIQIRCSDNSLILLCVVDANYNFIYIDVGTYGRANDTLVFTDTLLGRALKNNTLKLPDDGVFVTKGNFPLTDKIFKPYSASNLTKIQRVFNYRLSGASRISENALGLLMSRFRIFDKQIGLKVETTEKVVKAACALHNWFCKTIASYLLPHNVDREDTESGIIIPGDWRQEVNPDSFKTSLKFSIPTYSQSAALLRDVFASKFITT